MDSGPDRVFVTGALGSIGRAVADRYRSLGAEVSGVDLRADARLAVVAADVAEPGPWQRGAERADLVVHTAATVSFGRVDLWRPNVIGTRNALDAAIRAGARRFLHFSSVTVFSFDFPEGVDESYPVRISGVPYADTKIASEQVVLQAHAAEAIECTVVRPGDVYGPGVRSWTILPVEEIRARRLLLPAMGRGLMSPLYIDNLVDGVALASGPDGVGRVFTLTDGAGVPTREFFGHYHAMLRAGRPRVAPTPLARRLAAVAGWGVRVAGGDTEASATAVDYLCRRGSYSIDRARRELGFQPAVGLGEGMRRTYRWLGEAGLLS
ncbi:MAG: NAD-dependent epimerase/dehydratase family protein [Thermoleophilaceae bacterium]